jgi:hypothetical protein
MKKLIVLCLLFAGCGGSALVRDFDIGSERAATVGSVMLTMQNEQKIADHSGKITQQLIYAGTAGRVLKITYREFAEDFTRPTFFQDLQYELTDSPMIVFQNVTLQILESTNKEIRFKVVSVPAGEGAPEKQDRPEAAPTFPF